MAIWYEVVKNKEGIKNFLGSNCEFHDYRINRIEYVASKDYCDVYLSYCKTEGTVIRFVGLFDIHIHGDIDYEADWMFGSELFIQDNGRFIWINDENYGDDSSHIDDYKSYATWIEADRIFFAVTDGEQNPIEMPIYHIYRNVRSLNYDTNKYDIIHQHYDLKPFEGDFKDILKPKY